MSKRFQITEAEIESIKKLYISEQAQKEEDRKKILESIRYVDHAEIAIDKDSSSSQSIIKFFVDIKSIDPNCEIIFTKGGDRFADEIPEKAICDSLGIKIVDGLGAKTHNSSEMIKTNK